MLVFCEIGLNQRLKRVTMEKVIILKVTMTLSLFIIGTPPVCSSVRSLVSSCISSYDSGYVHLFCAKGSIAIQTAIVGSLNGRDFGCSQQEGDCISAITVPQCDGMQECQIKVPQKAPILCRNPMNQLHATSDYIQLAYDCVGDSSPKMMSTCFSASSPAIVKCPVDHFINILNSFEAEKNQEFHTSSVSCSYNPHDRISKTSLSKSFSIGCNGLDSCRLPAGYLSYYDYFQVQYNCHKGSPKIASKCMGARARTLVLECSSSSSMIILSSFIGTSSTSSFTPTDLKSCSFNPNDHLHSFDISNCQGMSKCALNLKQINDKGHYIQANYICVPIKPTKDSDEIEPYFDQATLVALQPNMDMLQMSDDPNAHIMIGREETPQSEAVLAKSSFEGSPSKIDHTATIVGSVVGSIVLVTSFIVACFLDKKVKRMKKQEERIKSEKYRLDIKTTINNNTIANTNYNKENDKLKTKPPPDQTEMRSRLAREELKTTLANLDRLVAERPSASASPSMPRKMNQLPKQCQQDPPSSVVDMIQMGHKREFFA